MPTSQPYQISSIVELIIHLNPQSILDVGVGFGKYGVLCREYLDLWDGRQDYTKFLRRIDGIEVFGKYITPMHKYVYNEIFNGDARNIIKNLKTYYDMVLLIDVLEHIPKKEGKKLIENILKHNGGILISTPYDIGHQSDAFGNPAEHHVAEWTKSELAKLGNAYFITDSESIIVYIGAKDIVEKIKRSFRFKKAKRLFWKVCRLLSPNTRKSHISN